MGRILIIDDEPHFRRVIADALQRRGYEIQQAENTGEGLRLAIEKQPELIISDVCMEGGDGLSLLKTIRADARTSTIPFIVMTGHPDFEGMLAGAENAADGYLPKPFKLQTLFATVEHRLNASSWSAKTRKRFAESSSASSRHRRI
jgi:DNA-binding response OmpR family regulator